MKIYNLNIDTSKPVKKVMQMQQNETGLLKLNVTNDGKSIRNLTTKVYDGETEVPSTDNGFKIDMGKNDKVVKIEAKSTPIMSEWEEIASHTTGNRMKTFYLSRLQLPAGTYKQEELLSLADKVSPDGVEYWYCNAVNNVVTSNCSFIAFYWHPAEDPTKTIPIGFFKNTSGSTTLMNPDEDIVITEGNNFRRQIQFKANTIETSTTTYPAVGEYTDYQLDTTIKPSVNAPYDGDYTEPLTEVEVDGVKFVPTTLTIDGVEYRVLAHTVESETPTEPTNDGE